MAKAKAKTKVEAKPKAKAKLGPTTSDAKKPAALAHNKGKSQSKAAKKAVGKGKHKADKGALDKLRSALDNIASEDVGVPPIPVVHLVAEGLALAITAKRREAPLLRVGLDKGLVRGLGQRAHALAEAQAAWTAARGTRRTTAELTLEAEAIDLRSEMVADGRFALRADRAAQATLTDIVAGEGLEDLVQDLKALASFFGVHKDALSKVGAWPSAKSARALDLSKKLSAHLADRQAGSESEAAALNLRNRAATYLADAMAEVRAAGFYAHRKQPRERAKFGSAYVSSKRSARKANADTPDEAAPPASPSDDK